tara:strand:+ start:496 stop:906 length:411 start_codon:yes stop_codon:yes gene_type:complete
MNIPIATITDTNVDTAIILNDNSNNIICMNTEAKQIINQMAFLEVSHQYDAFSETEFSQNIERGGNYNRDTLIFSVSRSHNNIRSLSFLSSTIHSYYDNSSSPSSQSLNTRNYEGKIIIYFFFLFIIMIIILNKSL